MSENQPDPVPGDESVTDAVIADFRDRREYGRGIYGIEIQTNNGRDGLVDMYYELIDAILYLKKFLMEREK